MEEDRGIQDGEVQWDDPGRDGWTKGRLRSCSRVGSKWRLW